MSFDMLCQNCGAPSGPATGTCPFCKSVLAHVEGEGTPQLKSILEAYDQGNLEMALLLLKQQADNPGADHSPSFYVLGVKILLETDGSEVSIRSYLSKCLKEEPAHPEALEFLEMVQAKNLLTKGSNDLGQQSLAERAYRQCLHLEKNPEMRAFFNQKLGA